MDFIAEPIVNKDKAQAGKNAGSLQPETVTPNVGPRNRALGEIYQRLYPEMQRPKPNQEAIAAALQAMQRLTMEADSEVSAEDATESQQSMAACRTCGHRNRQGNKFCGGCGASLEESHTDSPNSSGGELGVPWSANAEKTSQWLPGGQDLFVKSAPESFAANDSTSANPLSREGGTHYYHHHYHHHYFEGAGETSPSARANAPESAREADRLRVAAAAKGESMSKSEAAVRRLTQEWMLACNMRQLEELIELYAADALVLRSNLPPIRGAAAVREFFHASLEAGLGEVALDPMRVEVLGDVAHEVGRYSALVPGTVGKRREERGKYLWVFAKQSNGDWKLLSECWCSDLTLSTDESDVPKSVLAAGSRAPSRKG